VARQLLNEKLDPLEVETLRSIFVEKLQKIEKNGSLPADAYQTFHLELLKIFVNAFTKRPQSAGNVLGVHQFFLNLLADRGRLFANESTAQDYIVNSLEVIFAPAFTARRQALQGLLFAIASLPEVKFAPSAIVYFNRISTDHADRKALINSAGYNDFDRRFRQDWFANIVRTGELSLSEGLRHYVNWRRRLE